MTVNISTRWLIEVFPFETPIPQPGDTTGFDVPADFNVPLPPPSPEAFTDDGLGVYSVVINRSKGKPDGDCSIGIAGPLPPKFYVGAWCIVSSTNDKSGASLTRFIGQIENIDVSYNVSDSGNLYMQSSIKVREWSSMLNMLVKYDVMSVAYQLAQTDTGQASLLSNLLGAAKKTFDVPTAAEAASWEEAKALYEKAFNPYEFAHVVLKVIGALNKEDGLERSYNAIKEPLPNIATTAPYIPESVLSRLGIKKKGAGANPYESGFMRVITGIQSEPIYSDGNWNGVFSSPNIDGVIANYKEGYKKSPIKPLTMGLQVTLGHGASAWDLLSTQCDNSINEVYTDFLYEEDGNKNIVGKPVIVVRNKPFLLRKIQKNLIQGINIQADLSSFPVYDDLPRHRVETDSIIVFRLNSTFLNSPNYIRISYQPQGVVNKTGEPAALAAGLVRLDSEMKRFGGNEYEVSIGYTNTENLNPKDAQPQNTGTVIDWFKQVKSLAQAWYSYGYRMATGVLTLKENNLPISVGNNIQFTFGSFEVVAHVESVSFDFQIGPDGLQSNTTTLTLTHIVQAIDGNLDFIDMTHFGNLLQSTPTKSAKNTKVNSAADSILSSAASALGNLSKGLTNL
jgi:hypothetical protein